MLMLQLLTAHKGFSRYIRTLPESSALIQQLKPEVFQLVCACSCYVSNMLICEWTCFLTVAIVVQLVYVQLLSYLHCQQRFHDTPTRHYLENSTVSTAMLQPSSGQKCRSTAVSGQFAITNSIVNRFIHHTIEYRNSIAKKIVNRTTKIIW